MGHLIELWGNEALESVLSRPIDNCTFIFSGGIERNYSDIVNIKRRGGRIICDCHHTTLKNQIR